MKPTRLLLLEALGACSLSLAALPPARAATYDWTFTGTNATVNASGTLTTGAADMGGFSVTSITGTYNGFAINTTPLPLNTCCGHIPPLNDNIVYPNSNGSPNGEGSSGGSGSGGLLDQAGLGLLVPGDPSGIWVNLFFNAVEPYSDNQGGPGNATGSTVSRGNFTLTATSATPVPAALPLFATGLGGLGLLGWRRKRKARGSLLGAA